MKSTTQLEASPNTSLDTLIRTVNTAQLAMEDWRRIDIDALDPENFVSVEELSPEVPPVSAQEVQSKINNIRTLISKGSHSDAVLFALDEPPYGADVESKVCP